MSDTIILSNGMEAQINFVPLKISIKFQSVIAKTLLKANIDIDSIIMNKKNKKKEISIENILQDGEISELFKIVFAFIGEPEVYEVVHECMKYSICDGQKITETLFDLKPEQMLPIYYELALLCFKKNIPVFFLNLGSLFKKSQISTKMSI